MKFTTIISLESGEKKILLSSFAAISGVGFPLLLGIIFAGLTSYAVFSSPELPFLFRGSPCAFSYIIFNFTILVTTTGH